MTSRTATVAHSTLVNLALLAASSTTPSSLAAAVLGLAVGRMLNFVEDGRVRKPGRAAA